MPLPILNSPSTTTNSSLFMPSLFDCFNAAGQPALDLHSAMNHIPKSFTIGGLTFGSSSPPPPLSLWSSMSGPPPPFGSSQNNNFSMSMMNFTAPPPLMPTSLPTTASSPTTSSRSGTPVKANLSTPTLTSVQPHLQSSSSAAAAITMSQMSKYNQLLAVLEEMSKDVKPSYAGSKSSAERLKRGIAHARILVREALIEADRSARN
jgi:hypothetical protein